MFGADSFIGDLASRNHSVQDVIAVDAVVLQASGIEFPDGAGLATELTERIAQVIPELIETAVGFGFDADLIVARVGGGFDEMLTLGPGLTRPEQSDIDSGLRLPFRSFHCIIADSELVHVCSYGGFRFLGLTDHRLVKVGDNDDAKVDIAGTANVS